MLATSRQMCNPNVEGLEGAPKFCFRTRIPDAQCRILEEQQACCGKHWIPTSEKQTSPCFSGIQAPYLLALHFLTL